MDEITEIQRRTVGYWFVDGITETVAGTAMVLIGGLQLLASTTTNPYLDHAATALLFVVCLTAGSLIRALKERLTYPRTGYLACPPPGWRQRVMSILVAAVVVLTGVIAADHSEQSSAWTIVALTVLTTGICALLTRRARHSATRRYWLYAALAMAAGAGSMAAGLDPVTGVAVLLTVLGTVSGILGAVTLASYLHRHPVLNAEAKA
ncbi:MAG TPA: hypothetical protein VFP72_20215 [Kineosporiaceae bacterium]|nr:hypothetical protein [Kineosporiaceae bacterium]